MDNSVSMKHQHTVDLKTTKVFTALFEDHYDRVVRFVVRRVDNEADATELAAETFRRAWELSRREGRVPSPAWLFATARHTVGDLYRSRERASRLEAGLCDRTSLPPTDDAAEDVLQALSALSTTDRELLQLRYWDDLTVSEISHLLEVSASTLWVRLHRARRRFADHYTQTEQRTAS